MIVRFFDYRTIENYGKEIYTTDSLDDARRYKESHAHEMRFTAGGGKATRFVNGWPEDYKEIYWLVESK